MTTTKISTKRLDLLKLHAGPYERVIEEAIEDGFRMVRGCVSLKDGDGTCLYYRGKTIDVDAYSRASKYTTGGYRNHYGCETLREMKAEIDRRIEQIAAEKAAP